MVNHTHGGQLDQLKQHFPQVESSGETWLDLSTGISPWSYPHLAEHQSNQRLPTDEDFTQCEEAMAKCFGIARDRVIAVPGLEIVIRLLPLILEGSLSISAPTYGDYEASWRRQHKDIYLDQETEGCVRVVCQPNNPTGEALTETDLGELLGQVENNGNWLVVDESYNEASRAASAVHLPTSQKLVILKSFGKFFGLPGTRLGTVIAPTMVCQSLRDFLGDWRVSTATLQLGASAYANSTWQLSHQSRLAAAMAEQQTALSVFSSDINFSSEFNFSSEINYVGGTELFQCFYTPDAQALWAHLMSQGIYTRLFPEHNLIRVGLTKDREELERLISALGLDH